MNAVLQTRNVGKRYGRRTVLEQVDLDVNAGERVGLLGPNGAGKTTLIKILLGLVAPTWGDVLMFGQDLLSARERMLRRVGAVVEAPVFQEGMTAFQNLRGLVSLTAPVPRSVLMETLRGVGLEDAAHRRVETFSYGMKQRLGLAQALLPESRLLILDEPANGLDPHGISGLRRLLLHLARERGIALLISSHQLSEIERLCDRVVVIDRGRKVLDEPVTAVTASARSGGLEIRIRDDDRRVAALAAVPPAAWTPVPESGQVLLRYGGDADTAALVAALVKAGAAVERVERRGGALEDIFLDATREGAGDAFSVSL